MIDEIAVLAAVDQLKAAGIDITWQVRDLPEPRWPGREVTTTEHLFVHVVASRHGPQSTTAQVLGVLLKVCTQVHIASTFRDR